MENWKIKIINEGFNLSTNLFIYRKTPNGTEILRGDKIEIIKEGESTEPSFKLPVDLLQELADALDKLGYKPQKGYLEGKLEATENHLKDTRTLLKLK